MAVKEALHTTTERSRWQRLAALPAVGAAALLAACGPGATANGESTPVQTGASASATPGASETPTTEMPTDTTTTTEAKKDAGKELITGVSTENLTTKGAIELAKLLTADNVEKMSPKELTNACQITVADLDPNNQEQDFGEQASVVAAAIPTLGLNKANLNKFYKGRSDGTLTGGFGDMLVDELQSPCFYALSGYELPEASRNLSRQIANDFQAGVELNLAPYHLQFTIDSVEVSKDEVGFKVKSNRSYEMTDYTKDMEALGIDNLYTAVPRTGSSTQVIRYVQNVHGGWVTGKFTGSNE